METGRTIKFRIPNFDISTHKFQYFSYWGRIDHTSQPSKECFTSPATSNNSTKGNDEQYTGLMNIYENDLMMCEDGVMQVYWIDGRFILMWQDSGTYYCELKDGIHLPVIGNIHQLYKNIGV